MSETAQTLVIRADADSRMGAGHVMRGVALAQVQIDRGNQVMFVGNIEGAALHERICQGGAVFEPLAADEMSAPASLLDVLAKRRVPPDACWVVLDGYHLDLEYQKSVARAGYHTLIIDDHQECGGFYAEVVAIPNPTEHLAEHPAPWHAVILAGPRYHLLRREFRLQGPQPARTGHPGLRVLVCFGGADSANTTSCVLEGLGRSLSARDEVRVIIGPLNQNAASLERAARKASFQCKLLRDVTDMPAQMQWADFSVSAGGGVAWEMAAMGLPGLLVPVADNQRPNISTLASSGAALSLGNQEAVSTEAFDRHIHLLGDSERRERMSTAGSRLLDALGPDRILRILNAMACREHPEGEIRPASQDDAWQILRIANDPQVRRNAFSSDRITLSEHTAWFAAKLNSPDTAFYLMDLEGVVVALVRYDRIDEHSAEIDIAVHPAFRGRGLGTKLLKETAGQALGTLKSTGLRAVVFPENTASHKCFLNAGFLKDGTQRTQGKECLVFSFKPSVHTACSGREARS